MKKNDKQLKHDFGDIMNVTSRSSTSLKYTRDITSKAVDDTQIRVGSCKDGGI